MQPMAKFDHCCSIPWDVKQALPVAGAATIRAEEVKGEGLNAQALQQAEVSVRFRQGGEHCRLSKRTGEHSLKNLFQELGIVPWMRERIPLIYVGAQLAAVGEWLICEEFEARVNQTGMRIVCDYEHPVQ